MKNSLLILLQFLSISLFCQFQPLETLDEVMIGPENVDMHFEEQVEYYLERYNSIIIRIDNLKEQHQVELDRLRSNKKKRFLRKGKIEKEINILDLLAEDKIIVEDYIHAWSNFSMEDVLRFNEEYDSSLCYNISSKTKTYFPNEYSIEEENRDSIFWQEYIPNNMIGSINDQPKLATSSGYKWIKKRVDKNCLSNDPKDCFVACLVWVNEGELTLQYTIEMPTTFKFSEEKNCYIQMRSLERINNNQYRLFDLRENIEINLVNYQVVDCN